MAAAVRKAVPVRLPRGPLAVVLLYVVPLGVTVAVLVRAGLVGLAAALVAVEATVVGLVALARRRPPPAAPAQPRDGSQVLLLLGAVVVAVVAVLLLLR